MASSDPSYVIDTSVFVEAKRRYYAFDFCPGFWDAMVSEYTRGRILSVDKVADEIHRHNDDLSQWVKTVVPKRCFASTAKEDVSDAYGRVITWVYQHPDFKPQAKHKFAQEADGWILAYALVHGHIVVTQEVYDATAKKVVPFPNVCRAFGVPTIDTFELMRLLNISLVCAP